MERINAWTTYKKREEKKVMDLGKAYRAFLDSSKTERECARETIRGQYNPQNIYNMLPEPIHYDIAEWAMVGNRVTGLGEALWYFNPFSPNCRPNFPSNVGVFVLRIGNHCFYNPTAAYADT